MSAIPPRLPTSSPLRFSFSYSSLCDPTQCDAWTYPSVPHLRAQHVPLPELPALRKVSHTPRRQNRLGDHPSGTINHSFPPRRLRTLSADATLRPSPPLEASSAEFHPPAHPAGIPRNNFLAVVFDGMEKAQRPPRAGAAKSAPREPGRSPVPCAPQCRRRILKRILPCPSQPSSPARFPS